MPPFQNALLPKNQSTYFNSTIVKSGYKNETIGTFLSPLIFISF
jgi:hypothetical protein